ncbi:O-linked N-acetylglucosamine transferase, SPINDLY family protein [Halotia branconii]|uniref:protein O-GlcNAc transferase n=1 Tax=Halotia branconii CENA392 TaxID=1539056 RepID=A0AAJ6NRI7_9CYAN|nr:O-linked N-acetylglucosamine transferase, SPINDLY family protein [Halotia branconii]WGV25194.1 O-linked N-acetylglucosamine transferase, SPINDLY family protein [Halotia branconii CENA392]
MLSLTSPTQLHQHAEKYLLAGNYNQAASLYEEAITIEPNIKSYYWYLGLILLLQGQDVEAQTTWLMAIMQGEPEQVEAWNSELVKILQTEAERRERIEEHSIAEKIRQSIKEFSPQNIHNLLHLLQLAIKLEIYTGENLQELEIIEILQSEPRIEVNLELLLESLKIVLDYAPNHPSTLDFVEACLPYCKDNTQALLITLLPAALDIGYSQKQFGVAVQLCKLYLQLSPNNTEVIGHLASLYQNAGEYEKGIEVAKLFFSLVEGLADQVFANRQILRGLMTAGGHWEESCSIHNRQESLVKLLIEEKPVQLDAARIARLFNANFFTPYIKDNPINSRSIQNQLMQICQNNVDISEQKIVNRYFQGNLARKKQFETTKKLNIGYLSHCLRSHSVGWLARWLFQHHDRNKFQINGYFINTNPLCDPLHEWYLTKVDKTYKSNESLQLAEQIYQDEIDILIDLDSITLDTTCDVISLKPAPVQVTWLGWDASGIPAVDYFIADPYVLPDSAQKYYKEKIWRLPQTYIGVDGFEVSVPTVNRDQLDIPDDAIVYLCGQRGFKRHPDISRLQLQILKEVPNSYFLIKGISDEKSIKSFFEELTEEEGIDSSKLRFLPIVFSESIHRANLGIADIVLDTYPYNGATTTLETLWMCIPMVTRVGEQFAARNSYTMMMNAGITEGIAWTNEEYVEWGIRLGKDEALRQQIAWKLKQSRKTSPLWNGKQFTHEMENAYTQMWQKYISS